VAPSAAHTAAGARRPRAAAPLASRALRRRAGSPPRHPRWHPRGCGGGQGGPHGIPVGSPLLTPVNVYFYISAKHGKGLKIN
jgi:hypothetical protein